ncbi:MAG: hypothetical protein KKD74_02115 [Bacteroidetes bacterium]|nr:hypothetical protein [Bacteroidota bacterium]
MNMPFSSDQFFHVFELYNKALFPIQILLVLIGFAGLLLLHTRLESRHKLLGAMLGGLWIWSGLVYHILYFSSINKAAFVFGGLFIVQGILMLISVFKKGNLVFSVAGNHTRVFLAYFLILFGLAIYPVIGYVVQPGILRIISLGLPCPTTIFTFGFFLLAFKGFPRHLLIIPAIWSLIGTSAAINFGVYQDVMLLISAVIGLFYLVRKSHEIVE